MPKSADAPLPSDRQSWQKALAKSRAEYPYDLKALEPTQADNLAARALSFANAGSRSDLIALVDQFPELLLAPQSDRSRIGRSACILDVCLEKRHWGLACELLAKGAWCAARGIGAIDSKTPFASRIGQLHDSIALRARDALDIDCASKALEASGRPVPSAQEWAERALAVKSFHLAADIYCFHGLAPTLAAMQTIAQYSDDFCAQASSAHDLSLSRPCWAILSLARGRIDEELGGRLWRECILKNNMEGLSTLASWEIFPTRWAIEPSGRLAPSELPVSALCFAASQSSHLCFATLRNIPSAVEAARANPASPEILARCSISDIASLARLGVPLDRINTRGENFLHIWAAQDGDKPRDGWRTLLRLAPGLDAANATGQRPSDIARSALRRNPKKLLAFEALLAQAEKKHIQSAAAESSQSARKTSRL